MDLWVVATSAVSYLVQLAVQLVALLAYWCLSRPKLWISASVYITGHSLPVAAQTLRMMEASLMTRDTALS